MPKEQHGWMTRKGWALYFKHNKKRGSMNGWVFSYIHWIEPLALGIRAFCHITLTHIKVRSVKGIETTSVQKQLCQRSNKTLYSMSLCCPSLNTLVATLKWKKGKKRSCNSFYFLCLKSNRKQTSILLYMNISKVHCLYKRRTKKQKAVYRDQMWVGAHTSHGFRMILGGSHFIIAGTKQNCRVLCQVF